MKNLKRLIIVLCIILIIVIISIIVLLNKENEDMQNVEQNSINTNNVIQNNIINNTENNTINTEVTEEIPQLTFNFSLTEVTLDSQLYMVNTCINKYFNYVRNNNSQAVAELCENNNYTITENVKYSLKNAYVTQNEYQAVYYTCGTIVSANMNYEADIYIQMYQDLPNNTYRLKLITEDEFSNRTELTQNEKNEISIGNYNIVEYENIDAVKQIEIYLDDYKFYIFNNCINKAYNLLDSEYREKRFESEAEFTQYLINKQNELNNIQIIQYNINKTDDYTEYTAKDNNGNFYIIRRTSYMDYTVMLDNYTIVNLQQYNSLSQNEKKLYNVEVFIKMLNSQDYRNAYNTLDENMQTIFQTQQEFENYVKANFYSYNIITSKEIQEDESCIVIIKGNISTLAETMEKRINVTLGNKAEFKINFEI